MNTRVIRRKTHVRSVPLPQIEAVETAESENVFKRGKWAALSVSWRGTDGHEELVFDAIDSGRVRADEIARTILRQREYLSRPGL